MAIVRVRDSGPWSVRPQHLGFAPVCLAPGDGYDSDDPIVLEFGWAFQSDVEQATAAPGERRAVKRTAAKTAKK